MSLKLPSDITCRKEQIGTTVAFILRHQVMGDLGRLVISDMNGMSHFSSEVIGDPLDPLTKKRQEILEPITKAMITEVEKATKVKDVNLDASQFKHNMKPQKQLIPSKILPCLKCNKTVAHLIFADDAENQAQLEDYYRLMYPKIKEIDVPTWIIGKEEIYSPKNIITYVMKVWPKKDETAVKVSFDEFNLMLNKIQNGHCLN
ncbi:hypothetical protein [Silvanigrella aquatica]|uniref:Uncharacterized protein n=1 Tax=Silvanigrella aquatica TaxID=1915309 RepID=A0A1L4D4Y8_9BACT|nr:hypothetical protein [Silvanigrella aquatica]APJ05247.1 hypothetical protein AXG55_14590 [Silvanigrella aquatica]